MSSLNLDLLRSLGFDEEDCLNALRGMIRAIDGHGRAEAQTAQDDWKVAPATPGTPIDGGHEAAEDFPDPTETFPVTLTKLKGILLVWVRTRNVWPRRRRGHHHQGQPEPV